MILASERFELNSPDFSMDQHVRSKGVHVSAIIRLMMEKLHRSKFRADLDEQALEAYRILGFAWERVLIEGPLRGKRLERPGEVKRHGIIGSPDAVNVDEWSIEEWKCTWRSISNLIGKGHPLTSDIHVLIDSLDPDFLIQQLEREFTEWIIQMKAYCFMLNMNQVTLRIMFVNGDYASNRRPIPVVLRLRFTNEELDDNWDMLRTVAKEEGWL